MDRINERMPIWKLIKESSTITASSNLMELSSTSDELATTNDIIITTIEPQKSKLSDSTTNGDEKPEILINNSNNELAK